MAALFLVAWLYGQVNARADVEVTPRTLLLLDVELGAVSGLNTALLAQAADLEVKIISATANLGAPSALLEFARQQSAPELTPTAERKRLSAFVGAQAFLLSALGGSRARSFLLIGGGVEAVLNNVDYRVEMPSDSDPGSATSILVSPRTFRPIARLGLRVLL